MTILVYNAGFETKIQNTFWFVNSNHGSVLETCEVFRRISVQVLSLPSVSGDICISKHNAIYSRSFGSRNFCWLFLSIGFYQADATKLTEAEFGEGHTTTSFCLSSAILPLPSAFRSWKWNGIYLTERTGRVISCFRYWKRNGINYWKNPSCSSIHLTYMYVKLLPHLTSR